MDSVIAKISWGFLLLGSSVLLGAGYRTWDTQKLLARSEIDAGNVLAVKRRDTADGSVCYSTVAFVTRAGESREFTDRSTPCAASVDLPVQVLFDRTSEEAPQVLRSGTLWTATWALGGIGTLFSSLGGGIVLSRALARRRKAELMRNGTPVAGRLADIRVNDQLYINGRNPFQLVVEWQDERGKVWLFRSENLWVNPSRYVTPNQGVRVFIDRERPKRFHVDVSFLPEFADKA